jgi:hypothetical protein
VLRTIADRPNSVRLSGTAPDVEKVLRRNGFMSHYGGARLPDSFGTTIPYRRFATSDTSSFADYVQRGFIQNPRMPHMSRGLVKRFRESVFEIFENAATHSASRLGVFCCGQLYPAKRRLVLSISDAGVGIRANVEKKLGRPVEADRAIIWATEGRNTTKVGPIPGGLGLKLLKEFVTMNGGTLRIASDRGYWCSAAGRDQASLLGAALPGTTVCVEIDTADRKSYKLAGEPDEDIF